ncbi:MAG TPA: hypothetical protein VM580_16670 [Labilithrix sp.]|nr:hypothetical protein [Labilithrix sp.]
MLYPNPTTSLGRYEVHVERTGKRAARTATMDVRAAQVVLRFARHGIMEEEALRVFAVRVRDVDAGADGLDWLLYTNAPVLIGLGAWSRTWIARLDPPYPKRISKSATRFQAG